MRPTTEHERLGKELDEAWDDNEADMGEQAAYLVACEELGVDPGDGYDYIALYYGYLEENGNVEREV